MYQNEHNELFASIRSGKPINDGEWMAHSTLMALMGRMAAYTGQEVTWEQALNSQDKIVPDQLDKLSDRCQLHFLQAFLYTLADRLRIADDRVASMAGYPS